MRKILSIDGGGIKGVFAAAFLAEVEDEIDGTIGEYFDLIAGTSTGGIIALGLAMGMSARQICEFYGSEGPKIFPGNRALRFARWLVRSKYGSAPLRAALTERFGDKTLGDAKTRLLIPSQELDSGGICIFKTPHHSDLMKDWRRSAVDVAIATSAAPTYFPVLQIPWGPALIDGGLWANNPVSLAVAEALGHRLRWTPDDLKVLSIGCTSSPMRRSFFRARGLSGAMGWGLPVREMMSQGQSEGALGTAKTLLAPDAVIRIDRTVSRGRYALDDAREIESLIGQGRSEARHQVKELIDRFFRERARAFVPCRTA